MCFPRWRKLGRFADLNEVEKEEVVEEEEEEEVDLEEEIATFCRFE